MTKKINLLFFVLCLLALLLILRPPTKAQEVIPTPVWTPTLIPTLTPLPPTPIPIPTPTPPPPVVVVNEEPFLVITDGGTFDDDFYTAIVCANVPVFSQPSTNYNLIISQLYKGHAIDVTGRSQFWARVVLFDGRVGYVPFQYVEWNEQCGK